MSSYHLDEDKANILVVDDELPNLRLLVRMLAKQGYIVRPVPDGTSAIAAVHEEPPDLILLDIMMPGMSGYEICQKLKANELTRHIPVIFLSSLTEVFDKVKAFSIGAVDYITKPFQYEEVLARVETHLSVRQMQVILQRKNEQLEQEIAERKRIEQALQLTQFSVDNAGETIFWIGPAGNFIYANEAACRALGYTLGELRDLTIYNVDRSFPPAVWSQHWQEVRDRGSFTFESHHTAKDGTRFPVEVNANYLEFEGKAYNCLFARDITERKRTELALEAARKDAEAANRAKSVFLANVGHELRSPLNAIFGFAALLRRSQNIPAEERESLEIIVRNSEQLLLQINSLLDVAMVEAGHISLMERDFDLFDTLEMLEEHLHLQAEAQPVELQFDVSQNVPHYVRTDEVKLRQVLMNLMSSAIKFTHAQLITVDIDYDAPHLLCHINVGPYLPSESLNSLLPVSRKFLQLMGGDLVVDRQPERIVLKLTVRVDALDALPADLPLNSGREVVGLQAGQPVYRLLVVDDKADNRQLLVKLLEPLGFEVQEAGNGQEAIEVWEAWQPHLIWMDMRMPVMDGYEASRHIKKTTKGQATAIIALTASTIDDRQTVILSSNCDDVLYKPFRDAAVFDLLQKHLGVNYHYEKAATANSSERALADNVVANSE